jgi:hypothetical protein
MIKRTIYLLIIVFASCTTNKSLFGKYTKSGKDFKHSLTLNKDSTFVLVQQYFEVNSKCQGRWHFIAKDTLLLVCDEENLTAKLAGGYMSEREQKVVIINNKVKLKDVMLTKNKNNVSTQPR